MDYKEKYEQALERARKCWGEYNELVGAYENKGICEEIFPELKESEDEMIRKDILDYCNDRINNKFTTITINQVERWKSWLEKQGQDGKVWFYRDDYVRDKKQAYQDGIDNVLNNPQKYGLKKQGEQKPAWSEEDEKFFKTALWHISYSISNGKSTDFHCDTTEWLKSLKDRIQLQPQSHWKPTEEQIEALESATENCAYSEYQDCLRELIRQLKKLKG